jgi:anaerobic magnesium-protoporphyrin IX monomethyl ester cyclase
MKVFFIAPPESRFIGSFASKKMYGAVESRQKLGILYVAGALREYCGISPKIIDCIADKIDLGGLKKIISDEKPDVVGFSALTFNLLDSLVAAKAVKEASPETKVCFGGFHVTLYPQETLALPNVDYIVQGEGEITFSEFIKHIIEGKSGEDDLRGIDGLGFKMRGGGQIINKTRKPVSDLDTLPMPAHDLINLDKYSYVQSESGKVAPIQTSRGCPSKCVFCDMRMTKYRYRSEDNVLREIKILSSMGITEFFIIDDTFTINRERVFRLCRMLIEENLGVKFKISSRIDKMDEEMLKILKKAGCNWIHYGVESGSQRVLDYLQKEITVEAITRVFEMTKRAGMGALAYMMLGIPTETGEEIEQSQRLIERILPDYVYYAVCTPFPKTFLYESALKGGNYSEDYWHEFAKNPNPDFKIRTMNEHFSDVQLREMQDSAMKRFYSKPRVLFRELARTKNIKSLMIKLKTGARLFSSR